MTVYRIHYNEDTRDEVLEIVKNFSNDIIINDTDENSMGITIETDEAEMIYNDLLEEIGRSVYARK